MKSFRLIVHQKNFSEEDLIINPKDYPGACEGDIVEIYHPDDEGPRLLLQIKTFREDLQGRETISVEQSIASAFGLRTYADVCVRLVSPADVALDSVELTFKDQYMGRSEMWRLKNSLVNTCVYMNKKLEFCGNAVRCQVYEMWSQGDRVACGVITDDTKVVFRSSTSMVYLFLQMSSEMWDFDIHGDLYFEKAVNGFLADLFMKWKKNGSNHEVTIVLFSRTFYEANSLEEFPLYMRECLQHDYRGRYYEDFYRVAIQNERYDDWSAILVQLRRLFSDYLNIVLQYHSRPGQVIPAAVNSTAAQGNFLEVLNMSLNVFEKHYLDRSFDRTGQLSVVVTPGVGVFEVDRELTNVTKQRIIDNGVGSDLVCVGEQPLHAVPLLKFHNKDAHISVADDYSMPHWINLSFYSTNKKVAYSNFIPRIKLPPRRLAHHKVKESQTKSKLLPEDECIHNSFFDYDAYDAQVFQLPHVHGTRSLQRVTSRMKKSSVTAEDMRDSFNKHARRKMSDPDIHHNINEPLSPGSCRSQAISIPPANNMTTSSPVVSPHSANSEVKSRIWTNENTDTEIPSPLRAVVGSAGSPPPLSLASAILRPGRALINPFDPSHVTIKLTSNRRRWTHIFPKGPTGVLIQQHHYQAIPYQSDRSSTESIHAISPSPEPIVPTGVLARSISQIALQEYCKKRPSLLHTTSGNTLISNHSNPSKSLTLLWGATGEQEWTPALTTVNEVLIGVDWKSLTISACLPITTDYFPDTRALQNDYVVSDYQLLPDDVNADFAQQRAIYRKPLTTAEVFRELVSQRLSQGFQLIVVPPSNEIPPTAGSKGQANITGSLVGKRAPETENTQEYLLSIGRVFHNISLCGSTITVTRYRPRHPYPPFNIHYRYRFHAPNHDTYEVSWVSFTTEKLENYNWNYLDHYICTRGDTDFALVEAVKFWRFRVYLLPLNNAATKRIIEGAPHCDIYSPSSSSDYTTLVEGFLKFIETVVNKIKRPNAKKPRTTVIGNSPFRERLGSNRLPDRPRPRSGSKVMERGRVSPATEASQPSESQENNHSEDHELNMLKATSSFPEILESMRHPVTGVGFLTTHPSLPSYTFVSADAVHWLINHLEGINNTEQAVNLMNNMLKEQLICHASGDFTKLFVFGFYLYYMAQFDRDATDYCHPLGDLQSFENEWLEVEVRPPRMGTQENSSSPKALTVPNSGGDREKNVPPFLKETLDVAYLQGDLDNDCPLYKHIHLEIDVLGKSDRIEWGHAKYQTVHRPDQAYELVVQWVTSSGSIVSEMLFGWARKAQTCGLQMIPIPHDPLALPYSNKSDPLRGPIFIPLHIDSLMKNRTHSLFEDFRDDSWQDRMFLFQESIATRFGFVPCIVESTNTVSTGQVVQDHQYIHCTGAMFILIPTLVQKTRSRLTSVSQRRGQTNKRYPIHNEVVPSPHEAYITRHVSGKNKNNYDDSRRLGFLWSWNHMISRRWRTTQALDNTLLLRYLKDFKDFCSNNNNRLANYWEQCWEVKEDASTLSM